MKLAVWTVAVGASAGWPNVSVQVASEYLAAYLDESADQDARIGPSPWKVAGSTAMAIGVVSTSAWAAPARARQPVRRMAMPVRTDRVDVPCVVNMNRMDSKAQATRNIILILMFLG